MHNETRPQRHLRVAYGAVVRLYPKPHRERFADGMNQTFADMLRDEVGGSHLRFALPIFLETLRAVLGANMTYWKNIVRVGAVTGGLLLIPLVAMQFTQQVTWSWSDFVVAGALLFSAGMALALTEQKARTQGYRAAAAVTIFTALLLVWVNLAVGVIGNESNPANLMYFGVILVALVGAAVARLRPQGMVRVLLATAGAQLLATIVAVALLAGTGTAAKVGILNLFFVALWTAAAVLFRQAARRSPATA